MCVHINLVPQELFSIKSDFFRNAHAVSRINCMALMQAGKCSAVCSTNVSAGGTDCDSGIQPTRHIADPVGNLASALHHWVFRFRSCDHRVYASPYRIDFVLHGALGRQFVTK